MKEAAQTSQEEKKLLNMIEIKMYDIAQNVQIIGKQLTNNQIKDTIANTYSIFCQLKHTFENAGLKELYEVIRKMQINSVALSSILTERIDKKTQNSKAKSPQRQITPPTKPTVSETHIESEGKAKIQKLGGICLYNQSYMRGLQYYQVDAEQIEHQMTGKCRIKLSKKSRDQFLTSVSRELDTKAEVQVETIGDQIRKYIKDYKQNSKINSFVSYQKELVEIIDFFKSSELEAMNFLNKSPKNQQYTQDYINRLNDLQNQFKSKQKAQKLTINEKLKLFIINLRQKLHQMELKYQQKNAKLQLYEQSLKKQTCTIAIQTYDGLEARLKSQQNTIRELQQRYKILSQIKNKQINFQSKFYQAQHEFNVKVAQVTKLKTLCTELQSEIDYLKRIIRDNKEKLNFDLKDLDKRKAKNRKIGKEISKKYIEQKPSENRDSLNANEQSRDLQKRSSKMEKKSKRLQRVGAQTSSVFRPTQLSQPTKEPILQNKLSQQVKQNQMKNKFVSDQPAKNNKVQVKKTVGPVPTKEAQPSKQSFFKNESTKRNPKKTVQQERQVSFVQQRYKKNIVMSIPLEDNVSEVGPINLSIDDIKNQDQNQYEASSQKSKKNTLRQIINSSAACSLRSVQAQNKKSSKSVSKKCIILKDNKEKDKNILATTIKFQNMSIQQVMKLTIFPKKEPEQLRKERPSYPFANTQGISTNLIKSNTKISYLSNDVSKKKLNTQNSTYIDKNKQVDKQKPSFAQTVKRRENLPIFKKSISKKQNQPLPQSHPPNHPQMNHTFSTNAQYFQSTKPRLNKPSNSHKKNIKEITNYLQAIGSKNREGSLGQKLTSYAQQNWNTNESSQPNTFMSYIIEELGRQQLSFQQFQSIVNCIEQTNRGHQHIRESSNSNKKHQFVCSQQQGFKTIHNSKEYLINTKRYSKVRQANQQRKYSKEEKVTRMKTDQICGIGEHIYQNILQIHAKVSKCSNKDNQPCEHLIKYLSILKRVNQMLNHKPAIKLHIQKIGQLLDYNYDKQHKKVQQLKHLEKLQQLIQKANRSNYSKLNGSIEHSIEQRILPIINGTTTSYYKGKTKQIK